ncbi:MAG: phosphate ABC transporter substrate-binding protein PstS [Mycobacterium pseudokansasii]|uniref:phosphate ABC transporter substrate-binding protein PstS n=1 Tax=Mycobacterium pseudokansasii TaxID=2341080 RepID=UPI0023F052BE|nr:phosphate ABC transporter substrate-binding protein PstS [Mycobacterium pseudokansasii]MBY0389933.1 phosphate ABC transporter substrate-binding protein PstS [Mycobacterium pseudokansasii]
MGFTRTGVLSLLVASALMISGCGGNTNTPSRPSVKVDCGGKKELNAGGATAQQNAIQKFAYVYAHVCPGYTLDYEANGSGAGVEQFIKNETDLAGSGVPLDPSTGEPNKAAARCGSPVWELPAVFEPIAVTYHLSGVSSLKLDAPTMAKIFNGTITRWDDPAVKSLNVGTNLPSTPIHVIFRSDQSANSANFQQYLDAASNGAWSKGDGETFQGGVGVGAEGDNGVTATLQTTDGSITYTAWSFALGKQLNMAQIITSAGPDPVSITTESVGKTIAGAKITGQGNDLVLDTSSFYRPTQPGAYPIVEPTYEIVCSKYPNSATGTAVRAFMQAIIGPGQDGLAQHGSIPPPSWLQSRLATAVNAIS